MAIIAYLRDKRGNPLREQDWYCGRSYGFIESTACIGGDYATGDEVELHEGHGVVHRYVVADIDNRSAILVRT
jgi:hypothetical protein